jgi:N-acyl-D-amino-acid deacylase
MLDLIVRGSTVIDGTGAPGRLTDVGIIADRVVTVGDLAEIEAAQILDGSGLVTAPGFIDIHSHSDFTLLADPRAQSSIAQGVTTEVIGNCGHGCAPIADPATITGNIYGYLPGFPLDWRTTGGYLERLDAVRPAVNVVPLVPNGNLRIAALGLEDRPATPDELSQMKVLLEEGLEAGAFGFSTGLEYASERATTEAETVELCQVTVRAGGIYTTHTRNRDRFAVEAVEEALRVAERAGVPLQISHITPRKGGPPDAPERALEAVDQARARGLDVGFDMHTRLHGLTNLSAALPPWAVAGSTSEITKRLRDQTTRKTIKRYESLISSFGLGGWDRVFLFNSPSQPELAGKSIGEIAGAAGDPMETVLDLLLADVDDIHAPMCICLAYTEEELLETYLHEGCTIGSDATALATDGPLASSTFLGAYTWAAWFFRRFVRERSVLTIEAAVQQLADAPARRFSLEGRGRIEPGSFADLVVFDAGTFGEIGTLESPNQLAVGVLHVVVNGVVTLRDGQESGDRGGKVLRRNST